MASWCSRRSRPGGYGAQSSASNDGVFLPSELLREILLRVPSAKTICRFRAVCRSWRSLLSDPLFVAAHGASHPGPLFAVFVIRSRSSPGSRNSCIDLMDTSGDVVKRVRVAGGLSFKSRVQQRAGMVLIADHETERLRGNAAPLLCGIGRRRSRIGFPLPFVLGRGGRPSLVGLGSALRPGSSSAGNTERCRRLSQRHQNFSGGVQLGHLRPNLMPTGVPAKRLGAVRELHLRGRIEVGQVVEGLPQLFWR
ncbi:hypothetical protein EJB05_13531, partial [Eragrostis curvula]